MNLIKNNKLSMNKIFLITIIMIVNNRFRNYESNIDKI